ncbi:helix-turn-helix domain-containing protein [Nocardioides litoris]|uniref:helix-turn-helix domain-containing protein n=1 Tax=Nocardioides litoris TaxID=1926648 RepID=UPI001B86D0B8|nr:helix-turn-helix transcriptional regulator [Nocardioides litoris]
MSDTTLSTDTDTHVEPDVPVDEVPEDVVEVHRDGPLSMLVGGTAGLVAVAYLARAVGSGSTLDWVLCLVVAAVAGVHLAAVLDARAPLVVVDRQGVRIRRGRTWHGIAWDDVDRVEHRPRASLLRDGSLGVVARDGRAVSVRLGMSTRLTGCDWHELGEALVDLSEDRATVVEEAPAGVAPREDGPEPGREVVGGRRDEVRLDKRPAAAPAELEEVDDDTAVVVLDPAPAPAPVADVSATSTIVIDAGEVPATPVDPVVGPVLQAARTRLGLGVDQLAERTRIRPHVIESIELDDFGPCGGDFYARGHLRTLARVLGVDAAPLLASYDERYADAPIDPRRVFEAELATGAGSAIRGTRGRLNWSVLVAAVMAVVLVWSVARLLMDGPVPVADQPVLNGSPGGQARLSGGSTERVPVTFTAATGGARVTVRNGDGRVVFDEPLAFMQTAKLDVAPPVRISSTDGGLEVSVDGEDEGAIGTAGSAAQRFYVP